MTGNRPIRAMLPLYLRLVPALICSLALPLVGARAETLSSQAGALATALDNLKSRLAARSVAFRFSSGGVLQEIGRAQNAAIDLQRSAATGASREEVQESMNGVRTGIEGMRASVVHLGLSPNERSALHSVDFHYGNVVRLWQGYHGGGNQLQEAERPEPAMETSSRVEPSYDEPVTTRTTTTTETKRTRTFLRSAPEPSPARSAPISNNSSAKSAAVGYITRAYHIPPRSIEVVDTVDLGGRHRVTAYVNGHLRAIDFDRSGAVLMDVLVD